MKLLDVTEQKHGHLPFMLCWQSLDGRLEINYPDNFADATEYFNHLKAIGRAPKLYRDISDVVAPEPESETP